MQQVEPAMDRLAELLVPDDASDVMSAAGDRWWLEVGPVALGGKLATIQCSDALIAAITARDDGRLRVAVFRPLDAKCAEYLIELERVPHPEHGVCMRENNWEYAFDLFAQLYRIEAKVKDASDAQRVEARQTHSLPISYTPA